MYQKMALAAIDTDKSAHRLRSSGENPEKVEDLAIFREMLRN
jgi:hypothetical protein